MNIPELFDLLLPLLLDKFCVGASVYRTSTFTVGTGSWTDITFDNEDSDPFGMHDNSTNPARLTAIKPGVYVVSGQILWSTSSTGWRGLKILRSDSQVFAQSLFIASSATYGYAQNVAFPIMLTRTQYVTLQAFQDSGGDLTLQNTTAFHSRFAAYKVA